MRKSKLRTMKQKAINFLVNLIHVIAVLTQLSVGFITKELLKSPYLGVSDISLANQWNEP